MEKKHSPQHSLPPIADWRSSITMLVIKTDVLKCHFVSPGADTWTK